MKDQLDVTCYWCRIHLWFRYVGGFVRKVDDVTAYLGAQPSRLRAHHRNITTTRWRQCVTMETLWQQQYGGYMLLWKRPTTIWRLCIICKKNWAKYDKMFMLVFIYSSRYPCPISTKLEFSQQFVEKHSNTKFHENPSSGSGVLSMRTDGQTWRS